MPVLRPEIPEEAPEWVENIAELLEGIEAIARAYEYYLRVNIAFIEAQRKLVEAQIQVYRAQAETLNQLPALVGNFQQVATAVSQTTSTLAELTNTLAGVGTAFYEGIVQRTLQTRDAFSLFTGGLEMMTTGINLLQQGVSQLGNLLTNFSQTFSNLGASLTGVFDAALNIINTLSGNIQTTIQTVVAGVTQPLQQVSDVANRLGEVVGGISERAQTAFQSVAGIADRIRGIFDAIGGAAQAIFQQQFERLRLVFTRMQADLAPIMLQLQRLAATFQMVGQAIQVVSTILQVFLAPIGAALQTFARFANVWYNIVQILAETQDSLNQMQLTLGAVVNRFATATTPAQAFSAALNLIADAANRAYISMSALRETLQILVTTNVPLVGRTLEALVDNIGDLAGRLGRFPDEAMRAITTWAARGDITALQQLGLPLTPGQFQAWLLRRFGMAAPPPFLAPELRVEFAREMIQRLAPEAAPATLVQFVQAMRTLGQQLTAMLAQAEVAGGRTLLEQILNEIREMTRGTTGQALRTGMSALSTWIAAGIRDMVTAIRQIISHPIFQTILERLGAILYAIQRGFVDFIWGLARNINTQEIRDFLTRFAAQAYAFVRAGLEFAVATIRALIQFIRDVFGAGGAGGFGNFIASIIGMIARMMTIGANLAEVIFNFMDALIQRVDKFLMWMERVGNIVIPLARIATFALTAMAALRIVREGGLPGLGIGAGMLVGALVGIARDLWAGRGGAVPGMDLQELSNAWREQTQAIRAQINAFRSAFPQIDPTRVAGAIKNLGDALQKGADDFQRNFETYYTTAFNNLNQSLSVLGENASKAGETLYTFIQDVFKSEIALLEAFATMTSRLTTLAGEGVVRIGGLTMPLVGIVERSAMRLDAAFLNLRQRAFELWQYLAFGERLRYPEDIDLQTLAQRFEQALADLEARFRELVNEITEAISTYIDAARLRMERAISMLTAAPIGAVGMAGVITGGVLSQISTAMRGMYEIGRAWAQLMRIAAEFPGIERTVWFQRMMNELLKAELEIRREIANSIERMLVFQRGMLTAMREMVTLFGGLGANLQALLRTFLTDFSALPRVLAMGFDINRMGINLAEGLSTIRRAIQREVGIEFAMVFVHMFRGEFQRAAEQLATAMQRAFESMRTYLDTLQRQADAVTFHFSVWADNFNELRGLMGTIGAEMALFPIVLNQAIPALIQIRRNFEIMMAQAERQGDIFGFAVAHRNLIRVQRQIMEMLGITAMFLPAYTPEQVIRMMFAAGAPTLQQMLQVGRGGLLLEPLALRAVPIPIAAFYGFPAPAGAILQPGIFGGIPQAFWGMFRMTPWGVQRGIEQWMAGIGREALTQMGWVRGVAAMAEAQLYAGMAAPVPTGEEALRGITQKMAQGFTGLEMAIREQTFELSRRLDMIYNALMQRGALPPEATPYTQQFFSPMARLSPYLVR